MPSWLLKAGAQGAISRLPRSARLNAALQRRVTGSTILTPERLESKLRSARRHLRRYARATRDDDPPASALELGTGWHPVVPLGLALGGVQRVVSFDIQALADVERTRELLVQLVRLRDRGDLPNVSIDRARCLDECLDRSTTDLDELLAPLGVTLEVADDPASMTAARPFDLVVSDNTLEHIPREALAGVMTDLAGLMGPGAVMDHFIDMRDHYATYDKRLNRLNYLRYSDRAWALFNNRLQYQNRLRLPEYRELIEQAGFEVVFERRIDGRAGEFDDLALAPGFRTMPREDVLVLYASITAVASARAAVPTRSGP